MGWRNQEKIPTRSCLPLCVASRTQIKKIQELLSWGADPNIPFGPTSMTALHMAASWEKPNITHELLGMFVVAVVLPVVVLSVIVLS